MRVVHLSTTDLGGAAIAAQRLHYGLVQLGVDSSFLSLQQANKSNYPKKYKYNVLKKNYSILDRVKKRLHYPVTQHDKNRQLIKGLKGEYESFSFPETDYRVENDPLVRQADLVHLHWVSSFINYPSFFAAVKQPIVWTLHDMNPVLGGFHYQGDVDRNPNFQALDKDLQKQKQMYVSVHDSLTVVTPSQWLGNCSKLSNIFNSRKHYHIPYSLDTSIFKAHNQEFSRAVFNLPPGKKIILFVTERVSNYRKGFDLLLAALEGIDRKSKDDFIIVAVGENSLSMQDSQVRTLGRIQDEHLLSVLYSAADIFVLPSREDNLPNVMLESLACGTPIIAFPCGGMVEILQHGFNGILTGDVSAGALRQSIMDFICGKFVFDRTAIRNDSVKRFALFEQAQRYRDLYLNLLT